MHRIRVFAAAAALALLLGGCGGAAPAPADPAPAGSVRGELRIAAASSLQRAFDAAIAAFTSEHPEVRVTAIYDGSRTLVTQIQSGARADVLATADEASMAALTEPGPASAPVVFARNTLEIVVPEGNPAGVETLADLARPDVTVVLCAPQVPCGAAAQRLLDLADLTVAPASQEQNVTAVLTKVRGGEADAGLVYRTDAVAAGDVESFTPPGAERVVNAYPIVALADARDVAAARAFIAFITGPDGQRILADLGFGAP